MTNTANHAELPHAEAASGRGFLVGLALLFIASVAATVAWSQAMPMPWMPMCAQTWWGGAASFLGMWAVMMVAMMLPSLVPTLCRYRHALGPMGEARLAWRSMLLGAGYFAVWAAAGAVAWVMTIALGALNGAGLRLAVISGLLVIAAGVFQFTRWKRGALERCRRTPGHGGALSPDAGAAWRYGVNLGLDCARSCAPLMMVPQVAGAMHPAVMAAVAAAIALERLAPDGERAARMVGAMTVWAGVFLLIPGGGAG